MNIWRLLKSKFNGTNGKGTAQGEITHLTGLAFSLIQSEHYADARALLLRVLQHQDKIENPLLLEWILGALFTTWVQTEEYQEAATFFSDFIRRNPNDAQGFELRAASYWYAGKLQEAIVDYTRSLELKPDYALALSGRGQVFMEYRDYSRALEDLDVALRSIDGIEADANWKTEIEAFIRNGRAATFAGLGEFAHALVEFEKSIGLCPENAWVYFNRAEAYRNHGDQLQAAENYRLALKKKQPKLTALKREHARQMLSAT